MSFQIESELPMDVIDEILVADQQHILSFFEDGTYTQADLESIISQCRSFDLIRARNLYSNSVMHNRIIGRMHDEMAEYKEKYDYVNDFTPEKESEYIRSGMEFVSKGKLAIFLLGGGQASRMRSGIIKGTMDFGLPSHKTIFQRHCEHIRTIQESLKKQGYGEVLLHLYIMTSEFNRKKIETDILYKVLCLIVTLISPFEDNQNYGLKQEQITFFTQGSLPCVDEEGKCIMRERYKIALSPDGSGGLFPAIRRCGILDELKRDGVQYVQILGIDNTSITSADPLFIGYSLSHDSEVCIKCVEKSCPEERLSVVAKYGQKPFLAIYPEMSYRQLCRRDEMGNLTYRYGFICDSLMKVSFIKEKCHDSAIPAFCHIVRKAIPYYDPIVNRTIKPVNSNAYKMEHYLSDVFSFAQNLDVLVVPRCQYVTLRNGPDRHIESPESVVKLLSDYSNAILCRYGAKLVWDNDSIRKEFRGRAVEISTLINLFDNTLKVFGGVEILLPCIVLSKSEVSGEQVTISDGVSKILEKKERYNIYVI